MKSTIKGNIISIVTICTVIIIVFTAVINGGTTSKVVINDKKDLLMEQAKTNAETMNEWMAKQGALVHSIRNTVAFMDKKDTDQIMDYLEMCLNDNDAALMYYCCF